MRHKKNNKIININKKEKREAYIFLDSLIDFHFGTIVISFFCIRAKVFIA